MRSEHAAYPERAIVAHAAPGMRETARAAYAVAERSFSRLMTAANLDQYAATRPPEICDFEDALEGALAAAYVVETDEDGNGASVAHHLFLHRVLYRINRLKLFWYDDLSNYDNERSTYLRRIRDRVEAAWQHWELAQLGTVEALRREDVREALLVRASRDVSPVVSAGGRYFRDEVGEAGYRRLLAIASLDGLVEASQLSRTLGGVSNDIHGVMTRLLVEEYGGGRLNRKHSTFFNAMLTELGMSSEAESYFPLVPWEVLAAINHSFLLSERKRFYLRYVGGLLHTEISVPAAFDNYRAAAARLGMSEAARGYWALHIKEDERHGQWMLHDVALPLAAKYPREAWEIVLGYDQQRFMSDRAGAAIERAAREAERRSALEEAHGEES